MTVIGGKLTTFRVMAHDALEAVRAHLPGKPTFSRSQRMLDLQPADFDAPGLDPATRLRLLGRYGADAPSLIDAAQGELESIHESAALWAELRWATRAEGVIHLDDLLLRRVRLGLLLPRGGLD